MSKKKMQNTTAPEELSFKAVKNLKDLTGIHDFNDVVFSETPFMDWTLENLKKHWQDGWLIFSVTSEDETIAVVFCRPEGKKLVTKNTPIKLTHQGLGHSHSIKDFYESFAKEHNLNSIVSFCGRSNFRMISLNETHGYQRITPRTDDENKLIEWVKDLTRSQRPSSSSKTKS